MSLRIVILVKFEAKRLKNRVLKEIPITTDFGVNNLQIFAPKRFQKNYYEREYDIC